MTVKWVGIVCILIALWGYLLATGKAIVATPVLALFGVLVGIGYILYYEAMKRLKAAQVGALELAAPVFAAAFGYVFLAQAVTALQILGIALLFVGIGFLSKQEEEYHA